MPATKRISFVFLIAGLFLSSTAFSADRTKEKEALKAELNRCWSTINIPLNKYGETRFGDAYVRETEARECYKSLGLKIIEQYYPSHIPQRKRIFEEYVKASLDLYESLLYIKEDCLPVCGTMPMFEAYQNANTDLKNTLLKYIEGIDDSEEDSTEE